MERLAGTEGRVSATSPLLQYDGPRRGQTGVSVAAESARVLRRAGDQVARAGEMILTDPKAERWIVRVAVVGVTMFLGWLGYQVLRAIGEGWL